MSPAALYIAYIANNDVDGYAIVGNKKLKHLEEAMLACDYVLDKEIIKMIDDIKTPLWFIL